MSSTNKTTNYELSQFVGSDKPAWLADYNQDMSKIDTGIHTAQSTATGADGKADANATNIGDLTYLSTTAKNTLVAAINEVDSNANTAQTTANSAATTANQTASEVSGLAAYLNLGVNNTVIEKANMTVTGVGTIRNGSKIQIIGNTDNSLIKIYGNVIIDNMTPNTSVTLTINNTGLAPSSNININACGIVTQESTADSEVKYVDPLSYTINTNGTITVTLRSAGGNIDTVGAKFIACVIFLKNFGD